MAEPSSSRRRLGALPLLAHVAGLTLLLLALVPFVGTEWAFSADEGAALAQVRQLEEEGDWVAPFLLPEVLDGAVPFELSTVTDAGYLPFAKHPIYPVLLWPLVDAGGAGGAVVLSVIGTVLAAWGASLVARQLAGGLERTTLWTVGVASPLVFDSYLVIAHTLGAACAVWGYLAMRRAITGRAVIPAIAALVLFAVGAMLRNEIVLLGVAVAAVHGLASLRLHRVVPLLSGLPALGVAAGYLLDPRLTELAVGSVDRTSTGGTPNRAESSGAFTIAPGPESSWLSDRADGFWLTVVRPSYDAGTTAAVAFMVPIALAAMVAVAARRPQDPGAAVMLGVVAAAAAVTRLVVGGAGLVPGLLVAFPLLAAGVVAVIVQWHALDRASRLLVLSSAGFAILVVATQYSDGGSGEWGGRYFAVGLPLVVPPVLVALRACLAGLDAPTRRATVGCAALASVAVAVVGILSLRVSHQGTERLVDGVRAAQASHDAPVVLTAHGALARFNWRHAADEQWVTVADQDAVQQALERLLAADVGPVLVVDRTKEDLRAATGGTGTVDIFPVPAGWWAAIVDPV